MNYRELKDLVNKLDESQLNQTAYFLPVPDEVGIEIDSMCITDEDIYWEHHGDCLGNLQEAKDYLREDFENDLTDLIIVPKGLVTLHAEDIYVENRINDQPETLIE